MLSSIYSSAAIRRLAKEDLDFLFHKVLNKDLDLSSKISAYAQYHGPLNSAHQNIFTEQCSLLAENTGLSFQSYFEPDGRLNQTLLDSFVNNPDEKYFQPRSHFLSKEILLPDSVNQWRDCSFPAALSHRLHNDSRPALSLLSEEWPTLFVSPYSYAAYDVDTNEYSVSASSRALAKGIHNYEHVDIGKSIPVIIQDSYDGGNLAHFLLDWIPRILLLRELRPEIARSAVFIMGGDQNALQSFCMNFLCAITGLESSQFFFPQTRVVIDLKSPIYFFSDQRLSIGHPLLMCHPACVRLLRDLFTSLDTVDEKVEKLYISRSDAQLRRVSNEEQLWSLLERDGFRKITMSDYSPKVQFSLVMHARSIVSPHGMGLTSVALSKRLGVVREIFHPSIGSDTYAFLCKAIGIEYIPIVGSATGLPDASFAAPLDLLFSSTITD